MRWLQSKTARRALALAVVVLWAGPAQAKRAKKPHATAGKQHAQCRETLNNAEAQEQTNHLIDAARLFASCARKSCGALIYRQCKQEWGRLDRAIPSVILTASEAVGSAPLEVQVTIDGGAISPPPPGRPLAVDPGQHEFAFKSADGRTASQKVMIARGEHRRSIAVVLPPAGKEGRALDRGPDVLDNVPAQTHQPQSTEDVGTDRSGRGRR